ncbi:MAG: efflux RND transporter periplasmic adaptor subunit, partial [Pseudomonadota bacterium]|nr:efflux RND transporter periplasmic adaptor subunit [Pseudomonadota bacterium]
AREGEALASELARLTEALEPWLLEGAPVHYREAGLSLFQEAGTGRLWLQVGDTSRNPYGDTDATRVDWPDPMAEMQP